MPGVERLLPYYDFDEHILSDVADIAEQQNKCSFSELADQFGLSSGPVRERPQFDSRRTVEYITLKPTQDYDESEARILFSPHGIAVDESMAMRAMRLFAVAPDKPLYVIGSAALAGNPSNKLRLADLPVVAAGKLETATEPALFLAKNAGVTTIETLGYSLGAEVAAAATAKAAKLDIMSNSGVWVEPVATETRSPIELMKRFASSGKALDDYIEATASSPLYEARALSDKGFTRYGMGLLRLSNLAIGFALTKSGFSQRVKTAYSDQPNLQATVGWGTSSEINDADSMESFSAQLRHDLQPRQLGLMALEGMHHGGGDDIDLHAAIMLQGIKLNQI